MAAKGNEFELQVLQYLRSLFGELEFPIIEARRQKAGTQNGFDIRIGFLDQNGRERKFYFECKEYKTSISWNEISVKLQELYASNHQADGYIALSPYVDFSNIQINIIDSLQRTLKCPIKYWTPENNVKEYFSLSDDLYFKLYGERVSLSDIDRTHIRHKLRAYVLNILRERDELVTNSSTNKIPRELTLKIPRIHEDDIIGRTRELQEIHTLLFRNRRTVLINGLGGIGKTTIAQGYVSKYYNEYEHIAWVSQLTGDIVDDLINTEGLLKNLSILKSGKDIMPLFYELMGKLKSIPEKPNLLILDSVDETLTDFKDILPGQPTWHVLLTSRETVPGFFSRELGFLEPKEAVALFQKHCQLIRDEAEILSILGVVDYHTLTIEILSKTAQFQRTDVYALKNAIEADLQANVYIDHKGGRIDRVQSYLISIFNLSKLSEDELWVMKQFACLPTNFHAYNLVHKLISPGFDRRTMLSEALNRLAQLGWILHNKEGDAYKMHVVIKGVVIKKLSILLHDVAGLMTVISYNLEIQGYEDPTEKFVWIPFGQSILRPFENDTSAVVALLQNRLALILNVRGKFPEAKEILEKARHSDEQRHDLGAAAFTYSNLGLVYQSLGDYRNARRLLKQAVDESVRLFGADDPITLSRSQNLAGVLIESGDLMQGRSLLENVIKSNEKRLGIDHPDTTNAYASLGAVLYSIGEYSNAQAMLERAIRLLEDNFGPDHSNLAQAWSHLALVLLALDKNAEAVSLFEKVSNAVEKKFGSDHPKNITSWSNLAVALTQIGNYSRARFLVENALKLAQQVLGPNHPDISAIYLSIANVMKAQGDFAGARPLLEKAVELDELNFGLNHLNTAINYANLAIVLKRLGEFVTAREFSTKSLAIMEATLPEGHPYIDKVRRTNESLHS
ncbi:tetratricopeptide repeat protein [Chryseolinea lacunae]|uniref:Tetratricopeptide repeat protein n=1 Tax=Chryseolinea lacunae TaxID=2801331 RepID=A0ABS1KPZ3_9BACT|nr:tetratricopeptide repeat protein [Chryseolinea lacunae]MBL0741395.1 tetratricopeptide repeat protein [Chryseolinea lacunae]